MDDRNPIRRARRPRTAMLATLGALGLALEVRASQAGRVDEKGKAPAKSERIETAELGRPAPAFELQSLDGKLVKLADFKGKLIILEWLNPACPACDFAYSEKGPLRNFPDQLRGKGIVWLSIVSEKPDNPGGKTEAIRKFAGERGLKGPILLDPDGKVGKAFDARTTPNLFLVSEKGVLVYRGALDNAPLGVVEKNEARENFVEAAIADLSSGHAVTKAEKKPYGCPIQYARR